MHYEFMRREFSHGYSKFPKQSDMNPVLIRVHKTRFSVLVISKISYYSTSSYNLLITVQAIKEAIDPFRTNETLS